MRSVKGTKLEAQFDKQFISRNKDNQFGVFLLSESQGRGTDFKTNNEIEFSGGLYLIVADVFSSRSMDQILGRVGRLQKKGQYKIVIYKQGCKDEVRHVINLSQQVSENVYHIKLAELQQVLSTKELTIQSKVDREGEKILSPKTARIVIELREQNMIKDLQDQSFSTNDIKANAEFQNICTTEVSPQAIEQKSSCSQMIDSYAHKEEDKKIDEAIEEKASIDLSKKRVPENSVEDLEKEVFNPGPQQSEMECINKKQTDERVLYENSNPLHDSSEKEKGGERSKRGKRKFGFHQSSKVPVLLSEAPLIQERLRRQQRTRP